MTACKRSTSSLSCFFSVFCFTEMVPGKMEALLSSEVSFWALDVPLMSREEHTTCNAVEEICALTETVRPFAVLILHFQPSSLLCCQGLGEEGKGVVWFEAKSFGWGDFLFWGGLFGIF